LNYSKAPLVAKLLRLVSATQPRAVHAGTGCGRGGFFLIKISAGAKPKLGNANVKCSRKIPKGFRHAAQGCERRATLGEPLKMVFNRNAVVADFMRAVRNGRNRVAVGTFGGR
jgi:hypothetical protein